MLEQFIEKNFRPESLTLLGTIKQILERYRAQGYDLSVRQLYYQLVTINAVPNTTESYNKVQALIGDARLAGLIDWSMIADRNRETHSTPSYPNVSEFVKTYMGHFHLDRWANQSYHVEVMVEKAALEGVLLPVCRRRHIHFTANRGYSSLSILYETGKRLQERIEVGKKRVVIFYLGDHDPSGLDMTRDIEERLSLFAQSPVHVERLALNMDQVEEYRPPENPAKMSDSRAPEYVARYGESSWELDALPPAVLDELVNSHIDKYLDKGKWDAIVEKEEKQREMLADIVDTIQHNL